MREGERMGAAQRDNQRGDEKAMERDRVRQCYASRERKGCAVDVSTVAPSMLCTEHRSGR